MEKIILEEDELEKVKDAFENPPETSDKLLQAAKRFKERGFHYVKVDTETGE